MSLEELIQKKKQADLDNKPMFLTKKQREELAMAEKLKAEEELKKKQAIDAAIGM